MRGGADDLSLADVLQHRIQSIRSASLMSSGSPTGSAPRARYSVSASAEATFGRNDPNGSTDEIAITLKLPGDYIADVAAIVKILDEPRAKNHPSSSSNASAGTARHHRGSELVMSARQPIERRRRPITASKAPRRRQAIPANV